MPEDGKSRDDKIIEFKDAVAPAMGSIPSDAFIYTKVIQDIIYTEQIIAWTDHALSVKKIDKIS